MVYGLKYYSCNILLKPYATQLIVPDRRNGGLKCKLQSFLHMELVQ